MERMNIIFKEVFIMKGKTILTVLGVLAAVDLLDIASKGHSHAGWRSVYNDADEKWDAAYMGYPKLVQTRANMIKNASKMYNAKL